MARYYYNITSTKPLTVEKNKNNHRNIRIKGVTEIVENGNKVDSDNDIKKGKIDVIINVLLTLAFIDLLLFVAVILVADIAHIATDNLSHFTSNYIAGAGLLATLYSFPRVRKFVGKMVFRFGEYGNKIYVWIFVIIISAAIAIVLHMVGLSARLANTISAMCVIITLKNMR